MSEIPTKSERLISTFRAKIRELDFKIEEKRRQCQDARLQADTIEAIKIELSNFIDKAERDIEKQAPSPFEVDENPRQ